MRTIGHADRVQAALAKADLSEWETMRPEHKRSRRHCRGRDDVDRLHKVAFEILEQAVSHIDQASVASPLAIALFERMLVYTDCDRITAKLLASDAARRTVAQLMFPSAATESEHAAYFVMEACAITPHDIPWLLDELSKAIDAGTRRIIAEIIS
jgi:hypothetical protein